VAFSGTKDTTCYVCGPDNPLGLQVPFEQEGDAGSYAFYTARKEHGGWNGILHGGVTFSLMDEAFGWCLFF
jgi:acyl-coenzyme A thioesterase PaaI-like protein